MPEASPTEMVVLINVFRVEPDNQQRLVALGSRHGPISELRAGLHFRHAPSQPRWDESDYVRALA
jgi:hypothetical protein